MQYYGYLRECILIHKPTQPNDPIPVWRGHPSSLRNFRLRWTSARRADGTGGRPAHDCPLDSQLSLPNYPSSAAGYLDARLSTPFLPKEGSGWIVSLLFNCLIFQPCPEDFTMHSRAKSIGIHFVPTVQTKIDLPYPPSTSVLRCSINCFSRSRPLRWPVNSQSVRRRFHPKNWMTVSFFMSATTS